MRKLLLLCLLAQTLYASAQSPNDRAYSEKELHTKIDSIVRILKTQREDTNKVNSLNAIASFSLQNRDSTRAIIYINASQALAERLRFERGAGYAHLFRGQY